MSQPAWEGRSRGTGLGYRIFIGLLRFGGLKAAYRLLHIVGLYYRLAVPAVTRPLRYLYTERLGYSPADARKLIRRNIHFFGQTLIDKIAVLTGSGKELSFEEEGVQGIYDMGNAGNGGIVISAHLGNWEVAAQLLNGTDAPINIVMYDGEGEELKAMMAQYQQKRSFNIIYLKEDGGHIYEMTAALRRGELICLHADRFRPGNRTLTRDFLGKPAQFPEGPFILASKLRAPVCYVFCCKETTFHYHFLAVPAITHEGRGNSGAIRMLDDFIVLLERQIRAYPHQWFNYFDFWSAKA